MRIGAVFPQTEIGPDPGAVREYAQGVEEMGFSHLAVYDHVLGADTRSRPDWRGPYTRDSLFHEPLVLFGYLAALTSRLELVTSILILPQRQTALVAKQAAEVDVLSGGRLRLGVGLGWNEVEYEALGEDFHNRGKRVEEQIALLRALWTDEVVTFQGRWHRVSAAGLNPLPMQRPIPIWMGGGGNPAHPIQPALRRIAALADGWFPQMQPTDEARALIDQVHGYMRAVGRDPTQLGLEARVSAVGEDPEHGLRQAAAWAKIGATHLSVNTMRAGFTRVEQHLRALEQFKASVGGAGKANHSENLHSG